jgi:hypothetical protein
MKDIITSYGGSVNCPECRTALRAEFASTQVIICSGCGQQTGVSDKRYEGKFDKPEDDLCRLQIHSRGKYNEQSFVVTGRMRMIFEEESYVNLWHVELQGKGDHWIAESYHTYAFLLPGVSAYPLSHLLRLKIGSQFTMNNSHYYLLSSESKAMFQAEGELPAEIPVGKLMYVTATNPARQTAHYRVYSKTEHVMHAGRTVDYTELSIQNGRRIGG